LIAALRPYQIYSLLALAIIFNFYLVANEHYFLLVYPLAILIVIAALYSTDKVLLFVVFFTPLSINLDNFEMLNLGLYLPTEPLLFGIMVLYIMRILAGEGVGKQLVRHPITIAIMFYLGWILITTLTSSMFVVSLKFLTVKLWFIISCYFFGKEIFAEKANIRRFIWLYIIPFTGVILYTIIRHSTYEFTQDSAHWVMEPFFKDHTSYGALLAMFLPIIICFLFSTRYGALTKVLIFGVLVIFATGTVLSYTRAAWVSLVVAGGVFLLMKLRIDFKLLVILGVVAGTMFFLNYDNMMMALQKNEQDSSDDFTEHVQSISNISSDASNLERLNRWNCAMRMFMDRPVFGFGPGTYQFQYAVYQYYSERTIISTNFGDGGNAHSEYLGPLSESGLFGFLSFTILVIVVMYKGITLYYKLEDPEMKNILMGVLLGLVTYVTHGVLNNYLDTDKASVPFWGFIAIIVAIEIYHNKPQKQLAQNESATE